MISLSIDILRKIKYLHDHDVIIGDINLLNIPIGTPEYTAPEIQGRDFRNFLSRYNRTRDNCSLIMMYRPDEYFIRLKRRQTTGLLRDLNKNGLKEDYSFRKP